MGLEYFYEIPNPDVKANILTFEGPGILTDDSIAYMRAIEANLKAKPRVIPDTLRTMPFFIETWLTVKGGGGGAATQILIEQLMERGAPSQVDNFPEGAEIEATIDEMFDSPFAQLASIIVNHPKKDMAAMTFSVRAGTYDEAAEVWIQVWDAVAKANDTMGGKAPEGIKVAFVGNTATNYLFIAEELPWLGWMGLVGNIVLLALVAIFLRTWRAFLCIALLSTVTTLWWLGVLPLLGVGLAITLTLPLIFISAIGTDYAVHLLQNIHEVGNVRRVFETTGKAVLFSTVTTLGAFVIFVWIQNVAVSRTMVATSLAILLIFVSTLMVVPAFYPVWRKGWSQSSTAVPIPPVPRNAPQHIPARIRESAGEQSAATTASAGKVTKPPAKGTEGKAPPKAGKSATAAKARRTPPAKK